MCNDVDERLEQIDYRIEHGTATSDDARFLRDALRSERAAVADRELQIRHVKETCDHADTQGDGRVWTGLLRQFLSLPPALADQPVQDRG